MTTLLRRAAVLLATATAAAGLALPASATAPTTAAATLSCPRLAVCTLDAAGEFRIITSGQPYIVPPVVLAENQTPDVWCFFSATGFNGDRREVAPQETVEDFGFQVYSARPGPCTWS